MLVAYMNEFVSFVVINDGVNNKDASEGAKGMNLYFLLSSTTEQTTKTLLKAQNE